MGKMPFVTECQLFVRCEYKHAEEILQDYNDFYIFNMAQIAANNSKLGGDDDDEEEHAEPDEEKRQQTIDGRIKMATEHFKTLFGSKDFGESSMVGFKPAWYDLQKILLDEYKKKIPIQESRMNEIAPYLRNIASVMLFAERIVADLEGAGGTPEQIEVLKDGFKLMLKNIESSGAVFPEFFKEKKAISKFKKPEQYVEYARGLFGV